MNVSGIEGKIGENFEKEKLNVPKKKSTRTTENSGITLIALVVIIIVILIIAGISISILQGDNGIINKSKESKEQHEIAGEKETLKLAVSEAFTEDAKNSKNKTTKVTSGTLKNVLDTEYADKVKDTEETDDGVKTTFTDSERTYLIDADGDISEYIPEIITTATLKPSTQGRGDVLTAYATSFSKGTKEQYDEAVKNGIKINIISTDDSDVPVYEWTNSDKKAYWWSDAKIVYLNDDCNNMWAPTDVSANLVALENLDLSGFNTSKVKNMSGMFQMLSWSLKTLNISQFDTSQVTDMSYMFLNCYELDKIDLSSFDTSKVTDTSYMFRDDDEISTGIIYVGDGWNMVNVTNSEEMFGLHKRLPNYDDNYRDKTRAYYGGDGKGYLTYKASN